MNYGIRSVFEPVDRTKDRLCGYDDFVKNALIPLTQSLTYAATSSPLKHPGEKCAAVASGLSLYGQGERTGLRR